MFVKLSYFDDGISVRTVQCHLHKVNILLQLNYFTMKFPTPTLNAYSRVMDKTLASKTTNVVQKSTYNK